MGALYIVFADILKSDVIIEQQLVLRSDKNIAASKAYTTVELVLAENDWWS